MSVGGSLGNVSIGTSVGGVGVVNIAGVNLGSGYRSTLNAGGEIRLGDFGTGTLDIAEGALVKSGSTVIGGYTGIVELPADGGNTVFPTGAVGSASVHGTSGGYRATWENTGAFFVGNYNEGSLSIYDQGLVTSGLSLIGNRPGTVGHVEVSGSGSQWIVNNNLTAGSGGQGSLTITQGGYVEAQSVNIGLSSPDGSILVSDSSSHLNVIGSMLVAYTGNGTLTVANNGKVSAQFIDVAGYSGTGVINVGTGGVSGFIDTAVITGRRGNATLNFNHSDDIGFLPKLTGNLDVNQVNSGATTLTAVNDYAGMTTIDAGTLRAGLSGAFSSNSDHVVNARGTLDLNGFDQTIASLQNDGIITFAGVPGATLTLAGDYRGGGGTVLFNTVLGDDESSTDRLVVSGDTSGNSSVKVANISGSGAPTVEGIKIIDVAGISAGTFSLLGDYVFEGEQAVVGGAYGYRLYQGGTSTPDDGDWYLRSQLKPVDSIEPDTPLYQPGVPTYEAYPQLLLGLNSVPTLQQRVGSRYWNNAGNHVVAEGTDEPDPNASPSKSGQFIEQNAVWGRMGGEHHRINPRASTSSTDYGFDTFLMQAGVDGMLSESESGTLIGGVTVHYVHGKADTRSIYGNGDISTNGYGFGGTLTWYGENGFYIDGQTQATWYNSGLSSNLANTGLKGSNDGFGYSFSAETGKRIAIDENWSVTPQAQLSYSHVDFDSFDDVFGARVSLDRGESLKGRLGLSVERQTSWYNDDGLLNRANVYGISNLYYEFLDGTRVDVSGTGFTSRNEKLWGGIGLGGSYNWDNDKYSIYAEGSINTSLSAFADSYSYKGTVGFRVKW
ncbi:autotransporter outer membrane beta-barrel domain-containing protein [Rhizobium sp. AN95]|uniref:autotransporter family protein n=1 Tax=Rhizobium sp. AN95 TaxID=3035216 RepID=UPI002B2616E2|nr:autotransporter outer membrane beta-barrel domain-containing protein [Rhizobium sp. AN95]